MAKRNIRREPLIVGDGTALIPLTRGQFAVIDAKDIPLVAKHQWYAQVTRTGFMAARNQYQPGERRKYKQITMHRMLAASPNKPCVDHRDHDQLNNRRNNLRPCTYSENAFNRKKYRVKCTSRFKGVMFYKGEWRAQIYVNKKVKPLGVFETEIDAAIAYDCAALRCYGQFARINFRRSA